VVSLVVALLQFPETASEGRCHCWLVCCEVRTQTAKPRTMASMIPRRSALLRCVRVSPCFVDRDSAVNECNAKLRLPRPGDEALYPIPCGAGHLQKQHHHHAGTR
jgi:hypothetical protein